jgi:hypothetical protein
MGLCELLKGKIMHDVKYWHLIEEEITKGDKNVYWINW